MFYKTFQAEHFLFDHSTEETDMAHAASTDLSVAELGLGALSTGSNKYPGVVLLDLREELEEADVFVGHINDRVRAGDDPLFNPSRDIILAAAVAMVSELDMIDAEKHLLYVELTGHCRGMEDTMDAKAIIEAVYSLAMKLSERLLCSDLYENGKLHYGPGRTANGQLELVRKTFDDPEFKFATGGFVIPSWVNNEAR